MKLMRRIFAIVTIFALLLANGSWSVLAEDVLNLPGALRVIDEEAFYGDTSIDKVVLPDNVKEIRSRAFANSSLSEINLPDSLTFIDRSAFDGPQNVAVTANEGTYAYNWAVENGYIELEMPNLEIRKIYSSSGESAQTGQKIFWNTTVSNAVGDVCYSYELYKDGELAESLSPRLSNFYSFIPETPGAYKLRVECKDEAGAEDVSESTIVNVEASALRVGHIAVDKERLLVGEQVDVTVEAQGGYGALQYEYTIYVDDQIIKTDNTNEEEYSFIADRPGRLKVDVSVVDSRGTAVKASTPTIIVFGNDEARPVAPRLLFEDGTMTFSTDEDNCRIYPADRIDLKWEAVEFARSYNLYLERKDGSTWTYVTDETTDQCKLTLEAELFAMLTEETTFRLGISSENVYMGNIQYYYFKVVPYITDSNVVVDGRTSVVWNQSSGNPSMRVFDVSSQLPWTATTDAEWLSLMEEKNSLRVTMAENNGVFLTREADVVISNGVQNANIHVLQSSFGEWFINYPALSQNAQTPTQIGIGGQNFELDHIGATPNYAVVVICEFTDGEYIEKYRGLFEDYSVNVGTQTDSFKFEGGKTYKIVVMSVFSADYHTSEADEDILRNEYYVTAGTDAAYVLVNGSSEAVVTMDEDEAACYIQSSGLVVYTSDVDWLQLPDEASINKKLRISASELNMASTERVGHLYLSNGNATATITVVQKSVQPKLTFPVDISQDETNPSALQYDNIIFSAYGDDIMWYQKSGSTYVPVDDLHFWASSIHEFTEHINKTELIAGAQYRITVKYKDIERHYFINIGTSSLTTTVTLNGSDDPIVLETASEAYSQSITIKGSNSWRASSDASWLTISVTSGSTTQKSATIRATANTTGEERTGTITFTGGSSSKGFYPASYIRVTQTAESTEEDFLSLCVDNHIIQEKDTALLPGNSNRVYVRVFANDMTTVTTDSSWIEFADTSVDSGKEVGIDLAENDDGVIRTGNVYFSCGSITRTVVISQVPTIETPKLISDVLKPASAVVLNCAQGDLQLTWNRVIGAVRYEVLVVAPGTNTHRITIEDDGSNSYTITCPPEWLDIDAEEQHYIRISAFDIYDNSYSSSNYRFYPQSSDGVYIDKQTAPIWNNVTDYEVNSTYSIFSSDVWEASADASWISLFPTSGSSGDEIKVSLNKNTGAARTGHVTVSSGGNSAVLTVNQCAAIPRFPSLSGNIFSDDPDAPTLLPGDTDQILSSWIVEPQADYYYLELLEYDQDKPTDYKRVARSSYLKNGEDSYVFHDFDLKVGQLYCLEFFRSNNGVCTASAYYFMLDNGSSHVLINESNTANYEEEAEGGGTYALIDSSGVWSAVSDSDWITVGSDRAYSPKAIAELEDTLEEHLRCNGSGDRLYMYVFPNTENESRTGTVTVRSGSAEATITIRQLRPYTYAELISPNLGTSSSDCKDIGFGDLELAWSVAEGGTGRYEVGLEESDNGGNGFDEVYYRDGLTSTSHVIPAQEFNEGKYYRLYIGTEVEEGEGYYHTTNYFFRMGYENELALNPVFDWQKAAIGGRISIQASASGGAGSYQYAYELLRNGRQESITEWTRDSYYSFSIDETGEFQVRVYVKDNSGMQKNVLSGSRTIEGDTEPETPIDPIEPTDERYSLVGYVVTQAGVGIDGVTVYLYDAQDNGWLLGSAITDTSGAWHMDDLPACASATICFYSSDYSIDGNGSAISITRSRVLSPFYASLVATTYDNETNIAFSEPLNGSIVPYNETLYLSWNEVPGASLYRYSARWLDEEEAFIYRNYTTATLAGITTDQLRSGKTLQLWVAAFDGDDNQLCQQIVRVTTASEGIGSNYPWVEIEGIDCRSSGAAFIDYTGYNFQYFPIEHGVLYGETPACEKRAEDLPSLSFGGWSGTSIITGMTKGKLYYLKAFFRLEDGSYYESDVVTVTPSSSTGITGSFTMKKDGAEITTIKTGEDISFEVDVPEATRVRIVVDGKAYESYPVVDGRAIFTRFFSTSGIRNIQFQPQYSYEWGDFTETKTLTVTSVGTLAAPVIHQIDTQLMGQDVKDLSWDAVPNATNYTAYLYHNDIQFWPSDSNPWESRTENTSITIPGDCIAEEGIYTVKVVATGVNYDSSIATANFTVRPTNQAVEITYPNNTSVYNIGDTMHTRVACLQRNMNTRLRVVDPDGYSKDYDPGSDGVFYPAAEKPGVYKLTAFASTKSAFTYEGREATSATVTVTVNAPTVKSVGDPWGNAFAIVYSDESKAISAEVNCFGKVEVFMDDVNMGIQNHIDANDYKYEYSVSNLAEGRHTVSYRVIYGEFVSDIVSIPIFSVTKLVEANQNNRYVSKATLLEDYPGSNSGQTLSFGSKLIRYGTYTNDYSYLSYTANGITYWGFVKNDLLLESIPIDTADIQGVDCPDNQVVFVGDKVTYSITTGPEVSEIAVGVSCTKTNGTRSLETMHTEVKNGVATIAILAKDAGDYCCDFTAISQSNATLRISVEKPRFFAVSKVSEPFDVYRNTKSKRILLSEPIKRGNGEVAYNSLAIEIADQDKMRVLGEYGNYSYYVKYNQGTTIVQAFVRKTDVSRSANPVTRNAYILVPLCLSKSSKAEDQKMANNAVYYAHKLFVDVPLSYNNITIRNELTLETLNDLLDRIINTADYNDETYIYLMAHGSDSPAGFEVSKSDGEHIIYTYRTFVEKRISQIPGKIVLIMQPCYSGGIISEAGVFLDRSRVSIITSSSGTETAKAGFYTPIFTKDIYEACTNSSISSDGIIYLKEIIQQIPIGAWVGFTEHRQIWGIDSTRIF